MLWTIDYFTVGSKGAYRLVYRGLHLHAQLLRPKAGFWEDVLHHVKMESGRCKEVEDYDAAPNGWEKV